MRWFERHLPPTRRLACVPARWNTRALAIAGPHARALLQSLVRDDLSSAAFPFMSFRRMEIGMVPGYVGRVSFTGELGLRDLGDLRLSAGALRSVDAGRPRARAQAVRRPRAQRHAHREELRHLGARVSADLRPVRGRVSAASSTSRKSDFIGRAAAAEESDERAARSSCYASRWQAGDADAIGDEPIWHDGKAGRLGHLGRLRASRGRVARAGLRARRAGGGRLRASRSRSSASGARRCA